MKKKKSMLEKLTKWYEELQKIGNGEHTIGFFKENLSEIIKDVYKFPKGKFTKGVVHNDYFHWDYNSKRGD